MEQLSIEELANYSSSYTRIRGIKRDRYYSEFRTRIADIDVQQPNYDQLNKKNEGRKKYCTKKFNEKVNG